MLKNQTWHPYVVAAGSDGQPYIMVTVEYLDTVKKSLDAHEIRYEVDEESISINDDPPAIFITIWSKVDAESIEQIVADMTEAATRRLSRATADEP